MTSTLKEDITREVGWVDLVAQLIAPNAEKGISNLDNFGDVIYRWPPEKRPGKENFLRSVRAPPFIYYSPGVPAHNYKIYITDHQ